MSCALVQAELLQVVSAVDERLDALGVLLGQAVGELLVRRVRALGVAGLGGVGVAAGRALEHVDEEFLALGLEVLAVLLDVLGHHGGVVLCTMTQLAICLFTPLILGRRGMLV